MKRIKLLKLFLLVSSSLLLLASSEASETKTVNVLPASGEKIQRTIFVHGDILYQKLRYTKICQQATFDSKGQVAQYCEQSDGKFIVVNFDECKDAVSTAKALSLRDNFERLATTENEN